MTNQEALIIKKLDQLYEKHYKSSFNSVCCKCGKSVCLEIHKTSGGYGINGGSIFLTDDRWFVECISCYNNEKSFTNKLKVV